MFYIISPLCIAALFYYLYSIGYFYNFVVELYSGYKYVKENMLIPVKQTYTSVKYYVFYNTNIL